MSEPLRVEVRGVVKRFGDRQVLHGVDLTIQPGQTVALIGPSGGGKSTLLRCINGLTHFDAGKIQVGPHRLAGGRQPPRETVIQIRRLGMNFRRA